MFAYYAYFLYLEVLIRWQVGWSSNVDLWSFNVMNASFFASFFNWGICLIWVVLLFPQIMHSMFVRLWILTFCRICLHFPCLIDFTYVVVFMAYKFVILSAEISRLRLSSWSLILIDFSNCPWHILESGSVSMKALLDLPDDFAWRWQESLNGRRHHQSRNEDEGPTHTGVAGPCRNPHPTQLLRLLWKPHRPTPPPNATRVRNHASGRQRAHLPRRRHGQTRRRSEVQAMGSSTPVQRRGANFLKTNRWIYQKKTLHTHTSKNRSLAELAYHPRCWKPKTCFRGLSTNSETSLPHTEPVLVRHLKHRRRKQLPIYLLSQLHDRILSRHGICRRFQNLHPARRDELWAQTTFILIQMASFLRSLLRTWHQTQKVRLFISTTSNLMNLRNNPNTCWTISVWFCYQTNWERTCDIIFLPIMLNMTHWGSLLLYGARSGISK